MRRRYSQTPNLKKVFVFVGTKQLAEFTAERGNIMASLKDFAPGKSDYRPFASSTDKETLAAFSVPFVIDGARVVESQFTNQDGSPANNVIYDITLDATSDAYTFAQKIKDIGASYAMSLPASQWRLEQLEQVIRPDFIGKDRTLRLVKQGKAYNFVEAE